MATRASPQGDRLTSQVLRASEWGEAAWAEAAKMRQAAAGVAAAASAGSSLDYAPSGADVHRSRHSVMKPARSNASGSASASAASMSEDGASSSGVVGTFNDRSGPNRMAMARADGEGTLAAPGRGGAGDGAWRHTGDSRRGRGGCRAGAGRGQGGGGAGRRCPRTSQGGQRHRSRAGGVTGVCT